MESEETVIINKLDVLQRELAERECKQQKAEERRKRSAGTQLRERGGRATGHTVPSTTEDETGEVQRAVRRVEAQNRRQSRVDTLKVQIALLEELKVQVEAQRTESHAQFLAIKGTTMRSSRQGFWLTIGSSAISIVLGWLLSLLSTPLGVLHAFGR